MPGLTHIESTNAVIMAIIATVALAQHLAANWTPKPLMASSDRKTFPFGGRRRERETPAPEANDPELLGDVAAGHYGGGGTGGPRRESDRTDAEWDADEGDDTGPLPTILVPLRDPFNDPAYDTDPSLGPWPDAELGPAATEPFPHAFASRPAPFEDLATDEEQPAAGTELPAGRMPWLGLPAAGDDRSSDATNEDQPPSGWLRPIELGAADTIAAPAPDDRAANDIVVAEHPRPLAAALDDADDGAPVRNIARWALQRLIDHEEAERRLEAAHAPPPESLVEHALYAAALDARAAGVSSAAIDALVDEHQFDVDIDEGESWRIGADLDRRLSGYANRSLGHAAFPYLFITTAGLKIRDGSKRHVLTRTAAMVVGVTDNGDREVLTTEIGDPQDDTRWNLLLLGLRRRGLSGTRLVIADAHDGLRQAIRMSLPAGVTWQYCRSSYERRVLAELAPEQRPQVQQGFASVFDSDDYDEITARWHDLALRVADDASELAEAMINDGPDVLAFTWFPAAHWRKIGSTATVEPTRRFIRKQLRAVGVMPTEESARRILTAAAAEQHARFGDARRLLTGVSADALDATRAARRTHDAGDPLTGIDRRRADRRSSDRRAR